MRQYLIWTIIIWTVSILLVLGKITDLFPLNIFLFVALTFSLLWLTIKYPRQLFWLFLALLPLENIIISPAEIPFALRPFQLVGVILLVTLLLNAIFKNKVNNKNRKNALKNKNHEFNILQFRLPSLALFLKMELPKHVDNQVYLNPIDRLVLSLGFASLFGAQFAPNNLIPLRLSIILFSFLGLYLVARNFTRNYKQLVENVWFFFVGVDAVMLFSFYQIMASKVGWESWQVMDKRINATFTEPDWLGMYLIFIIAILLATKYAFGIIAKNKNGQLLQKISDIRIYNWSAVKIGQWLLNLCLGAIIIILTLTVSRSAWLGTAVVLVVYGGIIWLKQGFLKSLKEGARITAVIILAVTLLKLFGLSDFHLANRATSSVSGKQKITISCLDKNTPLKSGDQITAVGDLKQFNCRHINLEEIVSEKNKGNIILEVFRSDPSIDIRKDIYKKSWPEVKKHWLFGQGLGSSSHFLGKDNLGHGLNASNIFLEVLISMGVLGLALFSLVFITPLTLGLRLLLSKKGKGSEKTREFVAVFSLLTFLAILIPNLFNAGFLLAFFWIWLAMVISYLSMESK